jgi:DUF1365 family protein
MTELKSAIAFGHTDHQRFEPTSHDFSYPLYYAWVDLDETEAFSNQLKHMGRIPWLRLNNSDYLGPKDISLKTKALAQLGEVYPDYQPDHIVLLCQLRCLGLYFSPVNFVLFGQDGHFDYMMAEVTNTPWKEKHNYWLDLKQLTPHPKAFHVSPFNPMTMTYHWLVTLDDPFRIQIDCWRDRKIFSAGLSLTKQPLNQTSLRRVLKEHPLMTLRVMSGIYLQALKLWLKKTPLYKHPSPQSPK